MADAREPLREALKRTAVALKRSGVPFALAGGYAAWARGAPEPEHDVDFVVPETRADEAKQALAEDGLHVSQPSEDWLFKVYTDSATVDVLHRLSNIPVDEGLVQRADELDVLSVHMPVMRAQDVLTAKLRALNEQQCDFSALLPTARALREQIDWDEVAGEVSDSPFAASFLFLLDRLGAD